MMRGSREDDIDIVKFRTIPKLNSRENLVLWILCSADLLGIIWSLGGLKTEPFSPPFRLMFGDWPGNGKIIKPRKSIEEKVCVKLDSLCNLES